MSFLISGYLRTILSVFFLLSFTFGDIAWAVKKAQAAEPGVEIYLKNDFDSEVLTLINPGVIYPISDKPLGAFYKIKLKDGRIGYVADTQLDIVGEGKFQPKPFVDDEEQDRIAESKKSAEKNKNKKSKIKAKSDDEQDEDPEGEEKLSFDSVVIQMINYHEDTMGDVQIGDLFAIGYRKWPELYDYSSSLTWDISLALAAPSYYKNKTGHEASGLGLWSGFQIMNISPFGSQLTVNYGAGPFIKYTQFNTQTNTRSYSLQDMTVGVSLEAGLIFHFNPISFNLGLRYYWDKNPYGSIGLGLLF